MLMTLLLALPVAAHSGKTDSNGGHNSSSGYHYHHGYPAHSHRDTNNDGLPDCPYNFHDKTREGSTNSSGSNHPKINGKENQGLEGQTNAEKSSYFSLIIFSAPFLILIAYLGVLLISKILSIISASIKSKKILKRIGMQGFKLPHNVFLLDSLCISEGLPSKDAPYGMLTTYTTKRGRRYHVRRGCNGAYIPGHLYEAPASFSPCKLCVKSSKRQIVVPEWYKEIAQTITIAERNKVETNQ